MATNTEGRQGQNKDKGFRKDSEKDTSRSDSRMGPNRELGRDVPDKDYQGDKVGGGNREGLPGYREGKGIQKDVQAQKKDIHNPNLELEDEDVEADTESTDTQAKGDTKFTSKRSN